MAIINNNVQNVKFLRNGALIGSREAARTALETNKALGLDGSAILARYQEENGPIKTLVGFVYADSANTAVTIFDIDDAGADVDKKINELRNEINAKLGTGITSSNTATDQLSALSGTSADASGVTSVAGAKAYAKDYTDEQISSLDVTEISAGDGEFIKSVSETDGKISATTAAMPTVAEIKSEGQAIITIKQDKGTISAATGDIAAAHVTVADSGEKFTATTVEGALAEIDAAYKAADTAIIGGASASADTLGEIEAIINQMKADEKTYTIAEITSGLASNVRKAYKLVDEDGTQSGATIEIYKDSSLQSVELVNEDPTQEPAKQGQFLKFTYVTDSGTTDVVYLDVSTFLVEAEFKDGLQVNNGEVSIKLDTNGDDTGDGKFLTVGADGLKLDGVSDAITAAIDALDVTDTSVAGQYVATVSETNGVVSVTRANVSDAVLNGYAKGEKPASTAIAATDDVKGAISKLEHQIDDAKAAATTKVVEGTDAGNNLTISSATSETDGSTTYTIGLTDVASKTALDAEIAARKAVDGQSGQTYTANSGKAYISGATSLNDADIKLNDALASLDADVIKSVKVNNIALAEEANAVNVQISAANGTGATGTPIIVNTNDSTGAITIQLEGIDCGTY